jgi:hypothetical protein
MTLLGFMLILVVSSFAATFGFALLMMLFLPLFAAVARLPALTYPVIGVSLAAQAYFWGIWAAYCSAMAARWAVDATFPSLYYLVAFSASAGPIGWMSHKEMATARSAGEVVGIQRGTALYGLLVAVAFIVFSIWPASRHTVYGWIWG